MSSFLKQKTLASMTHIYEETDVCWRVITHVGIDAYKNVRVWIVLILKS